MSYILDALKKADAEREQGTIPGLLSQPKAPAPGDDDDEPKARIQPVVWVGAGVAICLIGVLSWQLLTREAAAPGAAADPAWTPADPVQQGMAPGQQDAVAPPPAPVAQQEAVPEYTAPPQAPSPTPQAQQQPAPPHQTAPVAPRAAPAPVAQTPPSIAQQAPPQAAPQATPNSASANPANPPSAQIGGPRIPSLSELPEHIRREVPQLTIGGAMYSETPSQRMLIINSQVFREGDQPYQGLVLEEIRLKSAVFQYRGQRYSVNY